MKSAGDTDWNFNWQEVYRVKTTDAGAKPTEEETEPIVRAEDSAGTSDVSSTA